MGRQTIRTKIAPTAKMGFTFPKDIQPKRKCGAAHGAEFSFPFA